MRAIIDFPGGGGQRLRQDFDVPETVLTARHIHDVAPVLAAAQDYARRGRWVLGFVAYEAAVAFDAAMRTHGPLGPLPLAGFAVYAQAQPHRQPPPGGLAASTSAWQWLDSREQIDAGIAAIRDEIARGAVYQVNYTTRLRARIECDGGAFFEALRREQPQGYCMYLDGGAWQLLSASPELFFDCTADGLLTTQPMKGTAARDADPQRDREAAERMHASAKERAENLMIVDLLRNDLSRIARSGSVRVPQLFEVQALPTVWQMTSTVQAQCRDGIGLADIFGALFPCGSVTGAPKIAAMASIERLERAPRGAYCGAMGVLRPGGHATFNVAIRTVMIDTVTGQAEYGVGSGITYDSSQTGEYEEWQVKQRVLQRATGHE